MFYREEKVFNYTKMSNYHLKDKNLDCQHFFRQFL